MGAVRLNFNAFYFKREKNGVHVVADVRVITAVISVEDPPCPPIWWVGGCERRSKRNEMTTDIDNLYLWKLQSLFRPRF